MAILEPDQGRSRELAAALTPLGVASRVYGNASKIPRSPGQLCLAFIPDTQDPRTDELLAACVAREVGAIFYSQAPSRARASELLVRGAAGYVAWPPDPEELGTALDLVLQFGRKRLRWFAAESQARGMLAALSRRERQVLAHMTAGMTNQEMAVAMGISSRTVELHRARILDKLGGTTVSAVKCGVYAGLDLDPSAAGDSSGVAEAASRGQPT